MVSSTREQKDDSARLQEILLEDEAAFIESLKPQSSEGTGNLESSSVGAGDGGNPNDPVGNFLPTEGGTMVGPISFYPRLQNILNDTIDISQNSGFYTGKLIVLAETGVADNLQTIIGAANAGQELTLQVPAGQSITINALDNIIPPNGVSFVLFGDPAFARSVKLQFDSLSNKWSFEESAIWKDLFDQISGGGSGTSFIGFDADDNLRMNDFDILEVRNIDMDGAALSNIQGASSLQFWPLNTQFSAVAGIGILYQVDENGHHQFFEGGTKIMEVGESGGQESLDMLDHPIKNFAFLQGQFSAAQLIQSRSNGFLFEVPDGDFFEYIIDGGVRMRVREFDIEVFEPIEMNNNNISEILGLQFNAGGSLNHNGIVTANVPYEIFHSLGKVLEYDDEFGSKVMKMDSSARIDFNNTVSSAIAGSSSLPANPGGFIQVRVGGANVKIPYYF